MGEGVRSEAPPAAGGEDGASSWLRRHLRFLMLRLILLARALMGTIAFEALYAVGWELNALEAWRKIEGRKVLVYNRADNIIGYGAASMHAALVAEDATNNQPGEAIGKDGAFRNTAVVEVTIRHANGWALHDFPLSLDLDAWYGMIGAERAALGLGQELGDGGRGESALLGSG